MLWIRLRASKALIPSPFINHWSNGHPLSAMESLVCRYCQKMDKELIKNPSGAEVQYFDGRNGQLTEENKKKHASEPKLREIPNKQTNLSSIQPPASRCGWSGFFHNLNDDRGPVIKSSFRGVKKKSANSPAGFTYTQSNLDSTEYKSKIPISTVLRFYRTYLRNQEFLIVLSLDLNELRW